jgi:hypothetical protein
MSAVLDWLIDARPEGGESAAGGEGGGHAARQTACGVGPASPRQPGGGAVVDFAERAGELDGQRKTSGPFSRQNVKTAGTRCAI